MSRLTVYTENKQETVKEQLYKDLERRIVASPGGLCPVDLTNSFVRLCLSQSCGKCTPCRVGLNKLAELLDSVLDGEATLETLDLIKETARTIFLSSDYILKPKCEIYMKYLRNLYKNVKIFIKVII